MSESEQQLLLSLKTIVEGLLSSQVSNVWNIYGGLNRLHRILEKILKHEFTVFKENGEEDIWVFVERLTAKTDSNASVGGSDASTASLLMVKSCDTSVKVTSADPNQPSDPAMKWLRDCIESHQLSSALSELLEDEEHITCCYSARAFLRQPAYAQACLTCLSALELSQLSLLTDIHPTLYLSNKTNAVGNSKVHRRCSSYPEKITKELHKRISDSAIQSNTSPALPPLTAETTVKIETPGHKRTRSLVDNEKVSTLHKSFPCLKRLDGSGENNVISHSLPSKIIVCKDVGKPVCRRGPRSWTSLPCLAPAPGEPPPEPPPLVVPSPPLSPSLLKIDYRPIGKPQRRNSFNRNLVAKPSLLENGTDALAPVITGFFPRPCIGQSLTSFLTSDQFSFTRAELDRENAHFRVSEAIIGAIEQVKWKKWEKLVEESVEESDDEICELKQRIRLRRKQKLLERNCNRTNIYNSSRGESMSPESSSSCRWTSDSLPSTSSSEDDVEDMELDQVTPSNLTNMKLAGITLSMGSLYSEADLLRRPIPKGGSEDLEKEEITSPEMKIKDQKKEVQLKSDCSKISKKVDRKHTVERSPVNVNPLEEPVVTAEGVALSLLRKFSDKQLPRASDIDWLVSEKEAPQQLLPLPESWSVEEESVPVTALRGTNQWAPPRPQIIFTIHPPKPRRMVMVNQKYMCGGCGMKVAPEYAHRFRYCDYLGKYFCTGCHTNQQAIIPARVLLKWDFSTFPVSNFSYKLLEQMSRDPLFNIEDINKVLFKKVSALDKVRVYRQQLYYLKDFLLSCRFANGLHERLEKEEFYLFREPSIYSIDLLVQVRTGKLVGRLATLLKDSLNHVAKCQLCLARGFVCELCLSSDVIYPWQLNKVCRCQTCGTCFHLSCHNTNPPPPCPKCVRKSARTAM